MAKKKLLTSAQKKEIFMEWTLDILIYTVVLNLFVDFVDDFYIESFSLSLLVAVVMKFLLVNVTSIEHFVSKWLDKQSNPFFQKVKPVAMGSILFLSKFVIIEVIDLIFGHRVDLHNFVALVAMILIMIFARKFLTKIYQEL